MSLPDDAALAGPALRTYERIADAWRLSSTQRAHMLGVDEGAYAAGRDRSADLAQEGLSRIDHILGINKSLHTLFPNPLQADGWVWQTNAATGLQGRPALERMLESKEELVWVRRYLDGVASGEGPG